MTRRVALTLLIALSMGIAACTPGDTTDNDGGPSPEDDATVEALRDIARATNDALADLDRVPAPVNALARPTEPPADAGPYELTGADSEPDAVVAAEAGRLGQPAVVWFHATWCQVCQEIEPEIADLRELRGDEIAFVRVDVDDPAAEPLERRFNVGGTPTFVMFNADGRTAARMAGWAGIDTMTSYLDQLE